MSTQPQGLPTPQPTPTIRKRRIWLRALAVVAIVLLMAVGGIVWYASTPQFQNLVREKLTQLRRIEALLAEILEQCAKREINQPCPIIRNPNRK